MTETMRAVGYRAPLPVDDPASLLDLELPVPEPGPHDLLVRVHAVSVNPVDTKVRTGTDPGGEAKVLGWDASGVVEAVGSAVSLFAVGDEVSYAGSIDRQGTDAELHLVHEGIVGPKPTTLTHAQAAALPLTTITAWEVLLDHLRLTRESTGTLLVLGAAGGVGSMVVQLARALTDLTVVATASRPESRAWVSDLGAHHVVGREDLVAEVGAVVDGVDHVVTPYSAGNVDAFAELLRPRGHVVAIDDPVGLDLLALKTKSITWHWELMFTRPLFSPEDRHQHELLARAAAMVDDGTLRTTLGRHAGPLDAEHLRAAHRDVEAGTTVGKLVLDVAR